MKRWRFAVEEILSAVSMGPIRSHFTPDYLSKRTIESVLLSQTAGLRARVARGVMDAFGTKALICIDLTTTREEAVKAVIDEFKKATFDIIWSRSSDECFGQNALIVMLPPPVPSGATPKE